MNLHKTILFSVVVIFAMVLLAACTPPNQSVALEPELVSSKSDILLPVIDTDAAKNTADIAQNSGAQTVEQRVVLKDASLQLVVENVATALDTITKMAETMGGWVINSNTTKSSYTSANDSITGTIAIRVPAAQFNTVITQIKSLSTSVDVETITGKDVTQEYTDLTSQVTNLQAAEKQLQTILDSAQTTDDVLKIYTELVRVRGEIETIQGRINYYKEASSFSSISVSLRLPTVPQASVQVDTGWSPATTVKGAFNALVNILQAMANLLIIVVVLVLPLVLIISIWAWVVSKLMRRFGWIKNRPRVSNAPSTAKVENDVG